MEQMFPEIAAIGIYNSKIAVKNMTVTKNRKTTMFEIELPMEEGGVSYINDLQMPIIPDMVICAKPGQMRHTKLPFKCYYIHIIVKEGKLADEINNIPEFIKIKKMDEYLEIFKTLCKLYENSLDSAEIMIYSLILKLIYMLRRDSKSSVTGKIKNSNRQAIEKVIKYIKENLTEDLSLEKISTFAGFSPIYFHNCFKASTGRTLRQYIEEQRIKKATNLLVATSKTLTEIAYECGFSSQSYFSFAFKRKMKLTPRQYVLKTFDRYEE